jgi:hypothetical protein
MAIKGLWRLNGNSNDASGNGNNGTDTNITYSQANGRLNQGAGFNGTSSKIALASTASLKPAKLTILATVRTTDNGNYRQIFHHSSDEYATRGIQLRKTNTNLVNFLIARGTSGGVDGVDFKNLYSTITINDGQWHQIDATYDGSYMRIFIDGKLNNEVAWTYDPVYDATYCRANIGTNQYYRNNYAYYWTGAIDEVLLDDVAWSPAKIKNEYSRVKGFF